MAALSIAPLYYIIAFFIGLSFHEFCHALTAYLLGDPTAQREGRLTLNPLAHIDLIGLLCLIFFKIGWARPVPFNAQNFKYPRFFSVLVALAGPFSNIILAFLVAVLFHLFPITGSTRLAILSRFFLGALINVNVMLGIFNLVPLPPLDGSQLIRVLIPSRWLPYYATVERFSIIALIILINIPSFQHFLLYIIHETIDFLFNTAALLS